MSQKSAYQELLKITSGGYGKIDAYIMSAFARIEKSEHDVESFSVPMLAKINKDGLEKVEKHSQVLSKIENIVALTATPAQLLELISIPEVISLEASR